MHRYFPEDAIYRVDHWLGPDALNDVLVARFANSTIEPLLNRDHVESVQITMAEAFDVADRGRFYDSDGAIRDVVQNHMLQVLATVLADPPDGSGPDSWLDAKARVISALRPLSPADAVRGQYDGYLDVEGVKAQHRPAGHEVAHCAHEHDGAVVPVRLAQQSLEVDGLHGAVPFNEQVLYGACWVTRHRIVGEETVDVHLSAPVDQNVLPRPADERRDRYRARLWVKRSR